MPTTFDFAEAVIVFAEYMGVGFDALSNYCLKTKYVGSVDALAHEIHQIPQMIFDIVSKKYDANNKPLPPEEIRRITLEFLGENQPKLTGDAAIAILKWVYYTTYREGVMEFRQGDLPL